MRMTSTGRRSMMIAASVGVAALALAGCSRGDTGGATSTTASSPGITDTTLTFGITTPLTGGTAGPGNCTADGAIAYFGVQNAAGGIKLGDGKTRKIQIKLYDDKYDASQALTNFQQMQTDGVFAAGLGLGTPTNQAWRQAAEDASFPQVLVMTGDPSFSNASTNPWALGLVPTYQMEGEALGKLVASDGQPHKVAILSQDDDYGKGYVEGFQNGIKGATNVTVVKQDTYEVPAGGAAADVSSQITDLASSGADYLLNAVSITPTVINELKQMPSLGWTPKLLLPSNTNSPGGILLQDGVNAAAFPGIYTTGFSNVPAAPNFATSTDGQEFLDAIKDADYYTGTGGQPQTGVPDFPHCVWSWQGAQVLEQAFEKMTAPTRDAFMTALRSISGFTPDFALTGVGINTTTGTDPAVDGVVVQKFNGKGYSSV